MKLQKRLLAVVLALSFTFLASAGTQAAASAEQSGLRFDAGGKFTIMVATDIHQHYYDESDTVSATKSADMQRLLRAAIAEAKPDLVIFNGDNAFGRNAQEMSFSISRIVTPVAEKGIPFAFVNGNHETDSGFPLEAQLELYKEYPTCVAADPVPALSGCGTSNLLIKNSTGTKDVFNLWLIDSGATSSDPNIGGYAWVQDDQIEWYEQTSTALKAQNGGNPLPSLLFQHIPVPEIYDLLRRPKLTELLDSVNGKVSWAKGLYVKKDGVDGYLGEGPCPPDYNNGQFASWVKQGDVLGAFFGHDHTNDLQGTIEGIMLAQCKTAGFVPYGDGGRQAVRLITLDESDLTAFETNMLTMKDLGLKADSVNWFNQTFTERQLIKFGVSLAVSVLFPVFGPLLMLKYIRF
jgi:hypothetical protein